MRLYFGVKMAKVMLYHPLGIEEIWGIQCSYQVFDDSEVDSLLKKKGKEKWYRSPLDFPKAKVKDDGELHS